MTIIWDQLDVILDIIGGPRPSDIEMINDEQIYDYLKSLPNKPGNDLSKLYPSASAESIDLLRKMLSFNPHERISCQEAMNHPFLRETSSSTQTTPTNVNSIDTLASGDDLESRTTQNRQNLRDSP